MRLAAVMTTSVMDVSLRICGVGGASSSLLQCGKASRRAAPRAPRAPGEPTTMPTWPSARSSRSPARGAVACGTIRSVVETMLSKGHGERRRIDDLAADPPCARAGQSAANRPSNISRAAASEMGGPSLAQSSSMTKVRASSPSSAAKASNLATVRAGSRLQKAHCSTSIGSTPSASHGGLRARPRACRDRRAPRPGSRRNARARRCVATLRAGAELRRRRAPSCRRGNSRPGRPARRAPRISGSRICSTWPATDSAAPVRRPASPSRAAARGGPAPASQRSSERSPMSSTLGGLISDGTNSTGGPLAAIIAQRRAVRLGERRHRRGRRRPRAPPDSGAGRPARPASAPDLLRFRCAA